MFKNILTLALILIIATITHNALESKKEKESVITISEEKQEDSQNK